MIQHRGAEEMWADGNTKPLQGNTFRVFRSMLMGIDVEYDDDIKLNNTHPMLLLKVGADGVISKHDIGILKQATGADKTQNKLKKATDTIDGQERILGGKNKSFFI